MEYTNKSDVHLAAKLNPSVTQGYRKKEDEFEFNKDAGMYEGWTYGNQESDYFNEKSKERYKIEAKNSELNTARV